MNLPLKPHGSGTILGQQPPVTLTPRKALLAVILCLCVGGAIVWWRASVRVRTERDRAEGWAQGAIASFEAVLNRALNAAEALAIHVRATGGRITSLQGVAGEIMLARPGLVSLELQPGGVTTDVAPRPGNERALGANVLRDPASVAAYHSRKLVAAGPLLLPRGQRGVVARLPIFVRDAKGKESFWGFVTASVALLDVATEARLAVLSSQGYDYVLYAAPPLIKAVPVISQGDPVPAGPVQQSRTVADLQFHLAVSPRGGWVQLVPLLLETIAAGLLAGLLGLYLHLRLKSAQLQAGWAKYSACLTEEHERSVTLAEELRQELHRTAAASAAELQSAGETTQAIRAQLAAAEDQARLGQQRLVEMEEQLRQARAAHASESGAARSYADALRTQLKQTEEERRVALEKRTHAEEALRLARDERTRLEAELSQTRSFHTSEAGAARSEADVLRAQLKQVEEALRTAREQRTHLEEELRQTRAAHTSELAEEPTAPPGPTESAVAPAFEEQLNAGLAEAAVEPASDAPVPSKRERTVRPRRPKDTAQLNLFAAEAEAEADESPPATLDAEVESEPPATRRAPPRASTLARDERSRAPLSAHDQVDFRKTATILYTLLAESDPGAMDCLSDHQKQLRSVFSSSAFEEFEKDVAAAAFPQALEILVKVARRHGVNLG